MSHSSPNTAPTSHEAPTEAQLLAAAQTLVERILANIDIQFTWQSADGELVRNRNDDPMMLDRTIILTKQSETTPRIKAYSLDDFSFVKYTEIGDDKKATVALITTDAALQAVVNEQSELAVTPLKTQVDALMAADALTPEVVQEVFARALQAQQLTADQIHTLLSFAEFSDPDNRKLVREVMAIFSGDSNRIQLGTPVDDQS